MNAEEVELKLKKKVNDMMKNQKLGITESRRARNPGWYTCTSLHHDPDIYKETKKVNCFIPFFYSQITYNYILPLKQIRRIRNDILNICME